MFLCNVRVLLSVISLSLGLGAVGSASAFELSAARPHLTFSLASYHHNSTTEFNEINPGIGIGVTFEDKRFGGELGFEAGQYRNSLNTDSYYVATFYDWEVADLGNDVKIRLGGFTGASHYPGDGNKFKDRGVPTIGNWVLVGGAQATVRVNDTYDVRMRVLPAGDVADALFTLQVGFRF